MAADDIDARFLAPIAPQLLDLDTFHRVREGCRLLAQGLNDMLPDGREKAESLTHLEQTMFWAQASLSRSVV